MFLCLSASVYARLRVCLRVKLIALGGTTVARRELDAPGSTGVTVAHCACFGGCPRRLPASAPWAVCAVTAGSASSGLQCNSTNAEPLVGAALASFFMIAVRLRHVLRVTGPQSLLLRAMAHEGVVLEAFISEAAYTEDPLRVCMKYL